MDPLNSLIENLKFLNLSSNEGRAQAYTSIQSHVNSTQNHTSNSYKAPQPQLFSGGRDALATRDWLEQLERYCKRTNFPEEEWSSAAVDYLRSTALTWFRTSKLAEKTPWELFKKAFIAEFRPADHERNILMELRDLKQRDVKEMTTYINQFRDLALQLYDPADEMLREYFVAGLISQTQVQVQIADPKSWQEAIQVSERINGIFARSASKTKTTFMQPQSAPKNHELPKAEPMDIDAMFNTTGINAFQRGQPGLIKLSPQERAHLTRTGGCFRCRKQGHLASQCRAPMASLTSTKPKRFHNLETGDKEISQQGNDTGDL
ncbi:hypothetical protein BGZ99_001147 [Dissophora globulifera]|uniref:CCHC-type domain-containing protein n=1 Tax=Dissophora globulifera TaxID=979702 RepID=A0A9P6UKN1_9FUNG|nr:hypothetical protein BGZ99_001147 [Dissophora globulifera]